MTPQKTPGAGDSRGLVKTQNSGHRLQRQEYPIGRLLARLDGVRETGAGRWLARCPGHEDRSASLSIAETADGTVLLHDFAGCEVSAICRAVGLDVRDLFPPRPDDSPRPRRPWPAHDVLAALATEAGIAAVGASMVAHGNQLTAEDLARLLTASHRLSEGARLSRVAAKWAR